MTAAPAIDLSDVQGFLLHEYSNLRHTRYVMLQVTNGPNARQFIKSITSNITSGVQSDPEQALNIAFTSSGLLALGLDTDNVGSFVREFREGMVTPHRQRLLGDFEASAPENWQWGGPANDGVHILIMVFGYDKAAAENYYQQLAAKWSAGLKEVFQLDGMVLPDNKEHFGFRDGIAQPYIKGSGQSGKDSDNLNAGEFLMGYKSEYNVYPDTPVLVREQGQYTMLHDDVADTDSKDLGHNGTYMVLRQLQQDVDGYWSFINEKTKNPHDGSVNEKESKRLAAKMMGRWPSGAPIVKFPDADPADDPNIDAATYINDNDFMYHDADKDGLKCPFGSHSRRVNPRDSFEENTAKESVLLSNRHRIIRRARPYGEPFIGSPANHKPEGEVGLMFACFNADISRQFEFIQYTWANYPKFKQLVNDPDPFIGVKHIAEEGTQQVFTIPAHPVNKYVTGLQRFVTVKGGAYFFFPSINTVKFLATL